MYKPYKVSDVRELPITTGSFTVSNRNLENETIDLPPIN